MIVPHRFRELPICFVFAQRYLAKLNDAAPQRGQYAILDRVGCVIFREVFLEINIARHLR